MLRNGDGRSLVVIESNPSGSSLSNINQFGSLAGNIILGFLVVLLLWRQSDVGVDKRIDDLKAAFDQRIDHLEKQNRDYASDINQYETLTWLHVTENDANFKHFGLNVPKPLPKPPRR
jgi:hypothetical protein